MVEDFFDQPSESSKACIEAHDNTRQPRLHGLCYQKHTLPQRLYPSVTVKDVDSHDSQKSEFSFRTGGSHVGYKATYEFPEPSGFSLVQKVQGENNYQLKNSYGYVRTEGKVHVRPATEHLNSNLRVDITVHGSNPELMHLESVEKTDSTLVIETPNHIKGAQVFSGHQPYVYIDATIFVAPGTVLQNFGIDTQSLAIIFHPGLDFTVKDSTTLFTISKPISMPAGSSKLLTTTRTRQIIVHSSFGSVTGAYPLYDLLSITTLSGSIDISYFPKNSSRLNPKPASLVLSTSSASIQVSSPVIPAGQVIPKRDYKNALSTSSGSITANLLHSSRTSLHAASGRIFATIHPHGNLSSPSHLSTDNKSGSTTVTVHNSLSHPSAPIRALSASHHYISGSLKLFYPSQWQGRIFGDTVSGSLNIFWDGVTVVKDHPKWSGGRKIEAERGEGGGSRLEFGGVSGSAVLRGESGGLGGMEL